MMPKGFLSRVMILFIIFGVAFSCLYSCGEKREAKVQFKTTVKVLGFDKGCSSCTYVAVVSYYLGELEIVDEIDKLTRTQFMYMKNSHNDKGGVDLLINMTASDGGVCGCEGVRPIYYLNGIKMDDDSSVIKMEFDTFVEYASTVDNFHYTKGGRPSAIQSDLRDLKSQDQTNQLLEEIK